MLGVEDSFFRDEACQLFEELPFVQYPRFMRVFTHVFRYQMH